MSTITIGHFVFLGRTFWHWCGVVYSALFAAAAIVVAVLDGLSASYLPNVAGELVVSFALLIWAGRMQTEALRVQSGWIGRTTSLWSTKKSRSGTHEQFAKTCRRGLGVMGWSFVFVGALSILIWASVWFLAVYASALHNELRAGLFSGLIHVFVGLAFLALGAVALNCRRILSSPPPADAQSLSRPS